MSIFGFSLISPDPDRLAAFYVRALGFARTGQGVRLGEVEVRLIAAGAEARPMPPDGTASDLWFQHFAIVTTDIAAAHEVVRREGARAISTSGPVRLPQRSGGVSAWKFRDPDGHPLELLQFPPDGVPARWRGKTGLAVGIDHSAISVSDADRSIAAYGEAFGFVPGTRGHNWGDEQAALDGLAHPCAEVVPLHPPGAGGPHLELLCYRPSGRPSAVADGDVAATRTLLEAPAGTPTGAWRDPDGHRLWLGTQSAKP